MNKILNYREYWRWAVIGLMVASVFGPWVYDLIHVPAQFPCAPPNVRLDGDFCGFPLPGIMAFFAAPIFIIVPVIPIVTTLFVLHDEFSPVRLVLHLGVLALALLPGLAMLITYSFLESLWGVMLYSGAAAAGLTLELLSLLWQQWVMKTSHASTIRPTIPRGT
jgi:hypothetical protein